MSKALQTCTFKASMISNFFINFFISSIILEEAGEIFFTTIFFALDYIENRYLLARSSDSTCLFNRFRVVSKIRSRRADLAAVNELH